MSIEKVAAAFELFRLEELQNIALEATLARCGIAEPKAFLATHNVQFRTAFRGDLGMGVTILSVTPKPPPENNPSNG